MKTIKQQKVNASMTDSLVNLSVIGMFQLVEDAVTEHMGTLKIDGITAKREYNAVWVIVRNRLTVQKRVVWNEPIVISTAITSKSRATMTLDVSIKDNDGALCAYSRVEVCALDLFTGRIRKIDTVGVNDEIVAESPEMNVVFAKYDTEAKNEVGRVQVRYTCIDFSRHTNNVEYIRFLLNTYSAAEMETRPIKEMEVVYANQSFENDVLSICKDTVGNKTFFALKNDGKIVTKGEIVF